MPNVDTTKMTAPEALFASSINNIKLDLSIGDVLVKLAEAKDYTQLKAVARQNVLGQLIFDLPLQRLPTSELNAPILNYIAKRIEKSETRFETYKADEAQNTRIDQVLGSARGDRIVGPGAAQSLDVALNISTIISTTRPDVHRVKIAIIGAGAAGLMMWRSLHILRFAKVTLYDKKGEHNGIWAQPNVYKGSKNNPRSLRFSNIATLAAAPGRGADVVSFLNDIADYSANAIREVVKTVKPNKNKGWTIVTDKAPEGVEYDIVVNCIGLGKPKQPKNSNANIFGIRWQQPVLERNDAQGKRFVFAGLGNSTAEMINSLHKLQDAGVDTDYRIITHLSRDAVFNPTESVIGDHIDGGYDQVVHRVFRDISAPNLTSYQGDLESSRGDYFRALYGGKIIPDINNDNPWDVSGKKLKTGFVGEFEFDQLYTLIGYKHGREELEEMSIATDESGDALYDYDGEFIERNLRGRKIQKGYFGVGAVLETKNNKNAIVIPGMMFRMPLTLFGIVMRAYEAAERARGEAKPEELQVELKAQGLSPTGRRLK